MAKKEFIYHGKTLEQLQAMSIKELAETLPAAARRKIKRGFTDAQKAFLERVKRKDKNIETHCRDMVVLPEMVGMMIKIHSGKSFEIVEIQPEMIGHLLGEFVLTRRRVTHSAPGIGATKSSSNISVK
ncbi:MAG: 30S ribosomal protein S19 [Nanoarchaeota archaeon]|nr:30S ribosomal protein S19 [Nanoarchaeota archaeon]